MTLLTDYLAESAKHSPDAPAVRAGDRAITYAELDERSSTLAASLLDAGVHPGDRVALWLSKSIEAIVAVYAALKCGAAYVPLDPAGAAKRAELILRDCAVTGLIASEDRLALLPDAGLPKVIVTVDGQTPPAQVGRRVLPWAEAVWPSADQPAATVPPDPDQLAYILYTSGSTGLPKGVMLSHRNAVSFVDWAVSEFAISGGDRLASHAPLHFDLSILDVFAAARAGACLVLVPERQRAAGAALNRFVRDQGITVWYSVPGALIRMLGPANRELLADSPLRVVLFAGEVFPIKHLRDLHAAVPQAGLWNLYGPTETNVCTYHKVTAGDLAPEQAAPPPIGRVCPYDEAVLLGPDGEVVQAVPGAEGELFVAGQSVMLGYWGDPLRTEERFRDLPGIGRAYRTGDLVRVDDRSSLVFVGRGDQQIKTRGYRVELGEVEAALLSLDDVLEVACVAVPDDQIGTRIEAYLVLAPGSQADESTLRRLTLELLPRYMVPGCFYVSETLPRTSTGKIDRQALRQRSVAGAGAGSGHIPPHRSQRRPV